MGVGVGGGGGGIPSDYLVSTQLTVMVVLLLGLWLLLGCDNYFHNKKYLASKKLVT